MSICQTAVFYSFHFAVFSSVQLQPLVHGSNKRVKWTKNDGYLAAGQKQMIIINVCVYSLNLTPSLLKLVNFKFFFFLNDIPHFFLSSDFLIKFFFSFHRFISVGRWRVIAVVNSLSVRCDLQFVFHLSFTIHSFLVCFF